MEIDEHRDLDSVSGETPSRAAPESELWSFLKSAAKVLTTLLGAGVVTTLLGAYLQQRSWSNDKVVTKIQDDSNKAFDVEQSVGEFIDARWAAADHLHDALKTAAGEEDWKHAVDKYYANYDDWQSNLTKWAGQIAFHIDIPFGIPWQDERKEISSIDCLKYTLDFQAHDKRDIDPRSASHVLQIIDHCHDLAKDNIERANANKHRIQVRDEVCGSAPQSLSLPEKEMCEFYTRTAQIWWLNNVLRCTLLWRAVSIRSGNADSSGWLSTPNVEFTYQTDDKPDNYNDCISSYRNDATVGRNPTSGRRF